jgi:hypothetical protein
MVLLSSMTMTLMPLKFTISLRGFADVLTGENFNARRIMQAEE